MVFLIFILSATHCNTECSKMALDHAPTSRPILQVENKFNPASKWGTTIPPRRHCMAINRGHQGSPGLKETLSTLHRPIQGMKQINPVSYYLELPRHSCLHPTFHVSQLKPIIPGPLEMRYLKLILPHPWRAMASPHISPPASWGHVNRRVG